MSSHRTSAFKMTLLAALAIVSANVVACGFAHAREQADLRKARSVMDARYGHNRSYPEVGASVRTLPDSYFTTQVRGAPYYARDGIWYRRGALGLSVVLPPIGAFISVLPPYYTTVWFGGTPYYYANNVYYLWDSDKNGYIVSESPAGIDDSATTAAANGDIFMYPRNGQSAEQQAKDRYECHRWAADQTGFDPTKAMDGDGKNDQRVNYLRAQSACLDARGYSVK
jgi:hypothetical protein